MSSKKENMTTIIISSASSKLLTKDMLFQNVQCLENLSNVALRPSRLQRHLRGKHPDLQDKNSEFFEAKEESFKRKKIVSNHAFRKYSSAEAVESSFEIAFLIALAKKPHNIKETLIKSCLKADSLFWGRLTGKRWRRSLSFPLLLYSENMH